MSNKKYIPKVGDKVIVKSCPDAPTKENSYSTNICFGDIVTVSRTHYDVFFITEEPKFGWNADWVEPLPEKLIINKLSDFLNNISEEGE